MKIVLTVDPEIPVPPKLYGGIERIVEMLILGLAERGVEVTLFAHPDSSVPSRLEAWRGTRSGSVLSTFRNMAALSAHVWKNEASDLVVHSFARMAYLLPILPSRVPKIQSYQRAVSARSVSWGRLLSRGTLDLTACSRSCADSSGVGGDWHVIPNGVRLDRYDFSAEVAHDAPMVFLGRLESIKGPQHAVRVAKQTGRRLIIAGNLPVNPIEKAFIEKEVLSHCDGKLIDYVGAVDDARKNEILRRAFCLLFPIEWEEPFGIVMAEALACGTPVVAFPRGATSEVVVPGINGFLPTTHEELIAAVEKVPSISRAACRRSAEDKYSSDVIVEQYLAVYRAALKRRGAGEVEPVHEKRRDDRPEARDRRASR